MKTFNIVVGIIIVVAILGFTSWSDHYDNTNFGQLYGQSN